MRKKINYSHGYGKTWQNFLDKLNNFQNINVNYWSQYELLGYFISKTNIKIKPANGTKHKEHPQIMKMRWLIKNIMGHKDFNVNYINSEKIKQFIDWSLNVLNEKKVKITSLNYLNEKWIYNFNNKKQAKYINKTISRSIELPQDIKDMVAINLNTFGDIAFWYNAYPDQNITNKLLQKGIDLCKIV